MGQKGEIEMRPGTFGLLALIFGGIFFTSSALGNPELPNRLVRCTESETLESATVDFEEQLREQLRPERMSTLPIGPFENINLWPAAGLVGFAAGYCAHFFARPMAAWFFYRPAGTSWMTWMLTQLEEFALANTVVESHIANRPRTQLHLHDGTAVEAELRVLDALGSLGGQPLFSIVNVYQGAATRGACLEDSVKYRRVFREIWRRRGLSL